jgi:NADPH:quinone reductase-like Zn-dependent oxidoreductase
MQIRPLPRGSLASLASQPLDASAAKMKPSDVLVAVKAVGINFRDVLNVLGMYPGDPGAPGSDCAGVIMRTGSAVAAFQPGDAVFGLAHGCLGTAVVSPAAMLAPMPSMLSFQEAATTPTVFITGGYCLQGDRKGFRLSVPSAQFEKTAAVCKNSKQRY